MKEFERKRGYNELRKKGRSGNNERMKKNKKAK